MKEFTGGIHSGGQILLDNCKYTNVTFVNCRLIYGATGPVEFVNCTFDSTSFGFVGAAAATVSFLQHIAGDASGAAESGLDVLTQIMTQSLVSFDLEV